ncbi:hypothetical protein [Nocardiopsis rhodophaea]|uniref:hypothetical protein n=1 Tax=Nocardiopsis rhodophaea TaxID=280238 RepID=UPI0031DA7456
MGRIVAEIYAGIWALDSARDRLRVYIAAPLDCTRWHRRRSIAVMTTVGSHRREDGTLRFASLGADDSITGELVAVLRQGRRDGEFRGFGPQVRATTASRALTMGAGLVGDAS